MGKWKLQRVLLISSKSGDWKAEVNACEDGVSGICGPCVLLAGPAFEAEVALAIMRGIEALALMLRRHWPRWCRPRVRVAMKKSKKRQVRRDRHLAKAKGWRRLPKGGKVGHGTSRTFSHIGPSRPKAKE